MMSNTVYVRGNLIPPEKRDRRFFKNDVLQEVALRKYWRLLDDGSPDPNCKPFLRKFEIELLHCYPHMGPFKIMVGPRGPKGMTKAQRLERDKNRKREKNGSTIT
ncbi:MAG: hypothetical protein ACEQSC_00980, partial [Candidatus Nanopelagicaceae bacterium]